MFHLKLNESWIFERVRAAITFTLDYISVTAHAFSMRWLSISIRRCKMLIIVYDCGNIEIIDDEKIYCPPFQIKEIQSQTEKSTSSSENQEE
jgi:hypothetical protein